MSSVGEAAFQKIIKSFLLGTVMKYRHCTVTASALIAAYYASPGEEPVSTDGRASESYGQLRHVGLCVLYLVTDPPNRHYGAVLTALLLERNRYHCPTWIYTPNPIASATFQGLYGAAFAAVLDTPELQLLHVTPTERSQDPGHPQNRPPLTTTCLKSSRAGPRNSPQRDKAKCAKSKNCKRPVGYGLFQMKGIPCKGTGMNRRTTHELRRKTKKWSTR
jgi:hypothetical protein